jgi:serine protease Do
MSDEFNNNERNENTGSMNNQNYSQEEHNFSQDSYFEGPSEPEMNTTESFQEQEAASEHNTEQEAATAESYPQQEAQAEPNYNYGQSFYYGNNPSQSNPGQGYGNPYPVYPTPQIKKEEKVKKKRKVFGAFKLTAAALAFGIIAGAAFQGYYYIMDITGNSVDTGSNNNAAVTEVSQNSDNEDTLVPATSSSGDTVTDVSDVVDEVMPSIVAINATVTTTASDFFGRTYSQEAQSSGSGIIIGQNDSNLLIVTNNHVIDGATAVEITFADDSTAVAEIKGSDSNADLAVLSVDMSDLSEDTIKAIKVATLGDSTTVEAGDMAIAIGNALGYGQSVTVGYISAVNREVEIDGNTMTLLQTDAAINPGNSGGALLNTEGQVIGINSVKYASTEVEGMGYAIPISSAIPMINELMNREAVSAGEQGYLGIDASTAQDVTEDIADRYNMPVGIYINNVISDSPAEKAGLEAGDIITGIDNISIKTVEDLKNVLSYKKAGDEIALKIQVKENGVYVEKTLNVTLGHK